MENMIFAAGMKPLKIGFNGREGVFSKRLALHNSICLSIAKTQHGTRDASLTLKKKMKLLSNIKLGSGMPIPPFSQTAPFYYFPGRKIISETGSAVTKIRPGPT
uniref:Uncharacterized protein n=1 Tax=Micrurus lemniscatus lemniscatus TaxID=129467 RepID=A0A2D4IIE4_MICLE